MNFNLPPLEILVFLLLYFILFLWLKFGRRLRRWLRHYFRSFRKQRTLKPKAPDDCPTCTRGFTNLPFRPKPEVIPWSQVKSTRGRKKIFDTNGYCCVNFQCHYFAIADAAIHALVSNGRRSKGRIQYWKCQACSKCRTSRYGTPLYHLKTPLFIVAQVMTAMGEGVSIAAASRIFGYSHQTITRWLSRCGQHSERLHNNLFHQAAEVGHLQLDELVTKVKRDTERVWLWTAVAAQNKLILAFHIGRRSSDDAHQLLHLVWQRLKKGCLPVFTSDGLNQYFYGITSHFGFWHKPPRARKYHWFPDPKLMYAQLRKRRYGRNVKFLFSIIQLGDKQEIRERLKALSLTGTIQTAFVERANLTLRHLIAPLARRTWSLAHDRQHLELHVHWGLAYYHFIRPHQSLTKEVRGPSKCRYRTPAMAAGLVRNRWVVRDLLQLSIPENVQLDTFPAMRGCQ
jgi:transposase-like protein/IS1 family transposase